MDPRKVFGIASAVMVVSLLGLYLTGFPLILAPVLSIGITFAVAAWVQMQKYYPGQNAKCAYGTILTLLPTLVALWVVQQAGGLASQLATKRLDSDIRTEIAAMLRDKPEDYPPLGEGLRQERLARLIEVRNNPNLSPRTAEFAEKATDYLENKLPQERGFRYRIATEARLRDAVIATETDPPVKVSTSLPIPPEGLLVVLEDRANLKPINGQRHALADLWSMRGISLRAACDLQEAEWLIVATWAKPILQVDRYTYPCTLSLFQRQGKQWLKMASQNLPTFATETDPDSEPDTAPARGYNQGERPRQEAIRKWLQGPQPVKAAN
jgi:hypothetical protein